MKKSTIVLVIMVMLLVAFGLYLLWPYISNYINANFFNTSNVIEELSSLY